MCAVQCAWRALTQPENVIQTKHNILHVLKKIWCYLKYPNIETHTQNANINNRRNSIIIKDQMKCNETQITFNCNLLSGSFITTRMWMQIRMQFVRMNEDRNVNTEMSMIKLSHLVWTLRIALFFFPCRFWNSDIVRNGNYLQQYLFHLLKKNNIL